MSKIGNAGKIYLMPVVNRPVSLAMNLFLIRVKEKLAISSYVYRFLLTNIGQKQINERCKGAATQTITKDNVRSIKIYLPNTLSEQKKIVEQLDKIQEKTKKLEAIYKLGIDDCTTNLDKIKNYLGINNLRLQ
jgi:type I restriction enzyme S subunit